MTPLDNIPIKRRGVLRILWTLPVVAAFFQSSLLGESPGVTRTAAPAWVKPQVVEYAPHPDGGKASNGLLDLLVDVQSNAREKVTYEHYATQFLNQSGVEDGSRLSISFDPTYQTLALNKLVIWRNGKIFDRLAKQEIKLLHREKALDRLLYDGRLSAEIILDDIRPGDILDYAYTLRGANPIFDGRYVGSFSTQWSTFTQRLYHRLLWPADRRLGIKSHGEDFKPAVTTSGSTVEYVWEKKNIAARPSDGNLPSWFTPYAWVQISEFQSWNEVARWACRKEAMPDKATGELLDQVNLIKRIPDRKNQAVAALRFVQNNIRYLGIEVGAHSHKPYPVGTVLQRRFGDCKDKALLLCTLLRQLGFEAYPAMVETDYRGTITDWLPSPYDFDHDVVQLCLDGQTYWLDPTRSNQGGQLDDIYFPDYGVALVAREDAAALAKITPQGFGKLREDVTESFEIPDYKGNAILKVHTVYCGREADNMRGWLADTSIDDIQKDFLNFYAKRYLHIEAVAPPAFSDDLEENEIVGNESYKITQLWQPRAGNEERLYGEFYARIMRDILSVPDTSVRSMPIGLTYPKRLVQTIRISFPSDMDLTKEDIHIDDQAFKFSYTRSLEKRAVSLRYAFESRGNHVDAVRTSEYLKNLHQVLDNLEYDIRISKSMAAGVPSPPAVSHPVADSTSGVDIGTVEKWVMLSPFIVLGLLRLIWPLLKKLRRPRPPLAKTADSLHKCVHCGKTEITSPDLDFRVAIDGEEYCHLHLPKTPPARSAT